MEKEHEKKIELLVKARQIAKALFPEASVFAVEEIAGYLDGATKAGEREFHEDLKMAIDYAKIVFETEKPTAEEAFFMFDWVIADEPPEEEGEED